MQREDGFQWIGFYNDFSNKLLEYKNNREALVKFVIEAFDEVDINMPRLVGDDQEFDDIDPFSVFGFFNKDINKRNELAFALGRKLGVYFDGDDLGFKGIPVIFALNALFYNFDDWRKSQIQCLWELFEACINLANTQNSINEDQFSHLFDESLKIKFNSVGKMTMALFWIRPNYYLNLDSINSWYVFESATSLVDRLTLTVNSANDIMDAKIYLFVNSAVKNSIFNNTNLNNLAELSSCAFDDAQAINFIMRDSNITRKSLHNPLISYINDLPSFFDEEVYKWIALKHFRGNWNFETDDFSDMFMDATSKTGNLLSGGNYLPRETIRQYSKKFPTEVKDAFVLLFDETKPLRIRIDEYIKIFDELKARLNSPNPHHQTANAISTYLWLMYPDKYYIYKQTFVVDCSKVLNKECNFNIGEPSAKILTCYEFYNHIRENIKQSSELIDLYNSLLTDDCYNDKSYVSLTNDFARYCSYNKEKLLGDLDDIKKDEKAVLDELITPDDTEDNPHESRQYWLYAPGENARLWDEFYNKGIMAIGWDELGDLSNFKDREDIREKFKELNNDDASHKHDSLACWEFSHSMKIGDIVFAKSGVNLIVGRGEITSEYYFDVDREEYFSVRNVKWTNKGEWNHKWHNIVTKTLTNITKYSGYPKKLEGLVNSNDKYVSYTDDDFLNEVFMDRDKFNSIKRILKKKKNIILQGPPGVGKTFCANRLAYSIMGHKNDNHVKYIQFHQSYSYEDFLEGYRPDNDGGFKLNDGIFYELSKQSSGDSKNSYYLIIDEINRGNISKIFGDIFMLVENDKRGKENSIVLPYSKRDFFIPDNLYIIGTMNTADRSIAIMDYALRRRFAFIDIGPQFDNTRFKANLNRANNKKLFDLIDVVKDLNKEIEQDSSLGKNFCIGHSYFVFEGENNNIEDADIECVVDYELIPLLKEYWFDDLDKVNEWSCKFRNIIR